MHAVDAIGVPVEIDCCCGLILPAVLYPLAALVHFLPLLIRLSGSDAHAAYLDERGLVHACRVGGENVALKELAPEEQLARRPVPLLGDTLSSSERSEVETSKDLFYD